MTKHDRITEQFLKRVTALLNEKKKRGGWLSNMTLKKGALSRALGVPEQDDIPVSLLQKKKRELQKAAEGDKTLSKKDRTLLRRITLALTLKKIKK